MGFNTAIPGFAEANVERAFAAFSDQARPGLLQLRGLIFQTAREIPAVGALRETLKWGQPAYLTPHSKSGTTLRLGQPKNGGFALFTHCQTSLISEFQSQFQDQFTYDGTRALLFQSGQKLPLENIALLIRRALTYHLP